MKRSRRLDFAVLPPTLTRRLTEATNEVRTQHERQGLEDHIASLTALSRLILGGAVPSLTIRDALEVEMAIATTKARLLLAKHKLEQRHAVPAAEVRHIVEQFIDILARYVPPEQRDAVGRELSLIKSRRDGGSDGQPRRR